MTMIAVIAVTIAVVIEIEHVEEIADGRAVDGNVGIVPSAVRVREVVTAAAGERIQAPVSLDELQDRDVVGIAVVDVPATGEVGDDHQRNAWSVAEEIERLDVA